MAVLTRCATTVLAASMISVAGTSDCAAAGSCNQAVAKESVLLQMSTSARKLKSAACSNDQVRRRRRNEDMCSCRRRSAGEISDDGWTCDVSTMAKADPTPPPTPAPPSIAPTIIPFKLEPTPAPTPGTCASIDVRRRRRGDTMCACRRRSGTDELEIGWKCEGDAIVADPRPSSEPVMKKISKAELRDKIEGYWVGQLVGNYMGWPFEFAYNNGPMPRLPQKYHSIWDTGGFRINNDGRGRVPEMLRDNGGAFTDDDTDIEFVTLHAVETYGLDLTYEQIAEEWKEHINDKIWVANKKARQLMDYGMIPPETGMEGKNEYWWAIDPQLVNEIWSAFYPGMLEKSVEKAAWGARITNSHWGTHATLFYAVLYSGAFFTKDVTKLYDVAMTFIPESSPFHQGLKDVKNWHKEEPEDWQKVWWMIKDKYFYYPQNVWQDVSSMINGLLGAMAFLYGEGDFMKTVGLGAAAGYDCDNQAATLAGVIGVMHGSDALPRDLTHNVLEGEPWSKPFNDMYKNIARDKLPRDNSISDIVDRILNIAHAAIIQTGGSFDNATDEYEIPVSGEVA